MPRALLAVLLLVLPARADTLEDARTAFDQNRLKDALALAERAVQEKSDDPDAAGIRGKILFELGRHDEALTHIRRAAELDAEVWGNLAASMACRVAFFRGQDDEVKRLLPTFEQGVITKHLPYLMAPEGLTRHQERKGHYIVYVDEALRAKKGHEWLGKMMELIYEAYSKVFPFPVDEALVSRVYVFGSNSGYREFNRRLEDDEDGAAGYYDPVTRILVVDAQPEDGEPANPQGFTSDAINTLFHEGFHQFMALHVPQGAPLWFDEGLAEYFGPSTPQGKKALNVGVVQKRDPNRVTRYERIVEALRGGSGVRSLRELMTRDFDGEAFGVMEYAQSWSFIHFLLHAPGLGNKGKQLLKDYFFALKEGGTPAQAFTASFADVELGDLEKAWRAYVLGL